MFSPVRAQLQIQSPVSRIVFQRNAANQSTFSVTGTCPGMADRIEVRLTPIQPNQGVAQDWQLLDSSPTQGQFKGLVTAAGGWYRLDVQALQQGTLVGTNTVDRVGVGEVFLVAGQSNGRGLLGLGAVAAADDRISCINYENAQNDTTQLPLPIFSPMAAETFVSPKGRSAWCWGRLGDLLATRLNVPISFYNVASAGTTVRNWRESAETGTSRYTFGDALPPGMPYNQLKRVLSDYVSLTGVRAVLWHQGEAEPYDTTRGQTLPAYPTNYTRDLNWLIGRSRHETGLNLSWVVARVSIDNNVASLVGANQYQPVIDAQNLTIQTMANVFPGPATDIIQMLRTAEGSGVHFSGPGLIDLANAWNASLTDAFFTASTPAVPVAQQIVDLQLSMQVNTRVATVGQPVLFSVMVTNTSAYPAPQVRVVNKLPPNLSFVSSANFTVNQGLLSAEIPLISAGQSVVLTYQAIPVAAGSYQNAAEISYCAAVDSDSHPGSDVSDGEDDTGWIDFRTLESGDDLYRTPTRPATPPSPAVISNQPVSVPGLADLSLQLVTSTLATAVGQLMSLTLIILNRGGATAEHVQIGCVLPPNLSFSGSTTMSVSSDVIRGTLAAVPAGGAGALWFSATPVLTGMAIIKAQVEASTPGDPDSTPNNGLANGEDDTAQSTIRIR